MTLFLGLFGAACVGALLGYFFRLATEPRRPLIHVCAWCGTVTDWDGAVVSHGLCHECAQHWDEEEALTTCRTGRRN